MPPLEDELQQIKAMNDLTRVKDKKSSRKGQLTKLDSQVKKLTSTTLAGVRPSDVERKLKEAYRSVTLFDAIQERYEHLLDQAKFEGLEEEITLGESIREENHKIIEQIEVLLEKLLLYDEGVVISDSLESIVAEDDLSKPFYQKEFATQRDQVNTFRRKTRCFSDDHEIEHIRGRISDLLKNFREQLAEASDKSTRASESSVDDEAKPVASSFSRLKLDLPKYSGKPQDWSTFKERFTSVMTNHGSGMPDADKCCHLLKAMSTDETRRVVDLAAKGKDGYKKALQALEDAFGRHNLVYPYHVKSLLTTDSYTYDRKSLRHMRETIEFSIRGLESCEGYTIEHFLAALVSDRFDSHMSHEWANQIAGSTKLPKIQELIDFFKKREFSMPDNTPAPSTKLSKSSSSSSKKSSYTSASSRPVNSVTAFGFKCPVCNREGHPVSRCSKYLEMSPDRRQKAVREAKLCFNCLGHNHSLKHCQSAHTCHQCQAKHHTSLHQDPPNSNSGTNDSTTPETRVLHVSAPVASLLSTALTMAVNGNLRQKARALLDGGASLSLITEKLASGLRLQRHSHLLHIAGVNGTSVSRYFVCLKLLSVHPTEIPDSITVKCHVVSELTYLHPPDNPAELLELPCIRDQKPIADPTLGGAIDLLLGVADCVRCSRGHPIVYEGEATVATPTVFGWTLAGSIPEDSIKASILHAQGSEDPLDNTLQQLWAMEKIPEPDSPHRTAAEEAAMSHFIDTHQILPDGRYSVSLPRCENPPELGASRPVAVRRFLQNEKSLKAKGKWSEFTAVLKEYLDLGHAEKVPKVDLLLHQSSTYYLPVHGVTKEMSTTTKLRAVFDASAKTSTGASLNDQLLPGPNLYPKLTSILTKFRLHIIAVTSDISKMFREVGLDLSERNFHRFVMRDEAGDVSDFRMRRLTFGVKSSPFLATMVLLHLAEEHIESHPIASRIIKSTFYVDDCLTGAPTVEEAARVREELCNLLSICGMTLRKWRSNSTELLSTIPAILRESADLQIMDPLSSSKTLGIHWHVATDEFHISTPDITIDPPFTKRNVASTLARVFDVLGLFSPTIVIAKILLQALWKCGLGWDDEIPEDLAAKWKQWLESIPLISSYPVSRRLIPVNNVVLSQQVHAFADASTSAYGAVIYLRTMYEDSSVSVVLVTSKARVAPIKTLTIPRLELLAAHILSKLVQAFVSDLNLSLSDVYAWTDSSIVLSWLNKSPSELKVFVANRVCAIQDVVPGKKWRHVRTCDNPADLASRGALPADLINSTLWWEGPPWLKSLPSEWPVSCPNAVSKEESELRRNVLTVQSYQPWNFFNNYSSFQQLTRIIAWIRRFISNLRQPHQQRELSTHLTASECLRAKEFLLRESQKESYPELFQSKSSDRLSLIPQSLKNFDVTIGSDGLAWASGRVRDPNSPKRAQSVIVLSLKSNLCKLFVKSMHSVLHHPGTAVLMSVIAEDYHIQGLRNFLKALSRSCSFCQRAYARPNNQKMGLLPADRTTPSPPFAKSGIDFAGPFYIRRGHTRRPTKIKVYVAVFICFVTKAVHLELCSDLTSNAFMAVLRRFCGRRGTPTLICSDNGSNLVGAKKELEEVKRLLNHPDTKQGLSHLATTEGLKWQLITPRAPHFGGLWEAAVKAMKSTLRKLLSPRILSFEELNTLLVEAEAILNSRPIVPISSTEPDQDLALTAGHFLIGRPLKAPPSPHIDTTSNIALLRR